MKRSRIYLLPVILLIAAAMVGTTLAAAQVMDDQPVDQTLVQPLPEGKAPRGAPVPAGGTLAILDDFNRADGPIGDAWTVHDGYCNVSSNAAVCGDFGRATFDAAPGDGNFAEADIASNGTGLQYTGLLLDYGAGSTNLFIKVQEQNATGMFEYAGCYLGNNGSGGIFGLGFFALASPFSTAHMAVTRVDNTVTIEFTNVDGGGQGDQVYVCDGAPAPEGTGIGILGLYGIARLDNFGGPGAGEPDITVDPLSLYASQPPDNLTTQQLNICNVGDAPLSWEISELPAGVLWSDRTITNEPAQNTISGAAPSIVTAKGNPSANSSPRPEAVLWEQTPGASGYGGISDYWLNYGVGTYSADDFEIVAGAWAIDMIYVDGFDYYGGDMSLAMDLNWVIYPDAGGVPAGYPGDGSGNELWSLTLSPSDPAVTLTTQSFSVDVVAATGHTLDLGPGHYWLVTYASIDDTIVLWYWFFSDSTNLNVPKLIDPSDFFGIGFTTWSDWTLLDPTYTDIAFRLEGEVVPVNDIPWLSESPITGTVPGGDCQVVDVTFDSTGLAPGDYFGELEVYSNDPDTPLIVVPVQLNVFTPTIYWDKYINGEPWYPGMTITVQTSDTIVVEEVLHLLPIAGQAAAGGQQPALNVTRTEPQGAPETLSGLQLPARESLPVSSPRPLQNPGLLYLTSLDIGDLLFGVYDPATDSWTTLAPYETGAQMAVSASGQLFAYGYSTGTIDLYDPATDTWSPVIPAPPGATGQYGNLEITNQGEFFYTEADATTLWYTSGGVWNTFALPFTSNVMGDYDPTTDQYVVGQLWTTNAHLIDVHTFAITDYTSPVGNGEYARFSVVMGNRYYFEAGQSNIHYFDLSNPAAPPVDTGVNWGFYSSAAGDRANNVIFNASLDSMDLVLYDATANTLTPLNGYGNGGWHSSVAYAVASEPQTGFAQIEYWNPERLQLLDWNATGGEVVVGPDSAIWTGEILEPTTITLTKWFHVEPSTWITTTLWEELWLDGNELEQRPVLIEKLPPELWIDAAYDPEVYADQPASFTLNFGNTGGYENDVMVRNEFPAEAPFDSSVPPPDRQDPNGLWAEWDVGDLPMDAQGSIEVTVMIQSDVPADTIIDVWDGIFNHLGELADDVFIDFVVLPTVDLGVIKEAPAEVYLGDVFTYTIVVSNYSVDDAVDAVLQDTLPVSVTYVSDDIGCVHSAGVVTCDIFSLEAGGSIAAHILVTADATGLTTNMVEFWSADYDPDLENNTASAETLISERVETDLEVTKEAPAEVSVGDTFTYTVVVTNLGPAEATDINIEDTLPVSVTYVSDNLGCSYAAGVLSCQVASLAVDESVTLTIVVTADETGEVSNSVQAWAAEDDPDMENNTASAETLINEGLFYYFVPVVYKH